MNVSYDPTSLTWISADADYVPGANKTTVNGPGSIGDADDADDDGADGPTENLLKPNTKISKDDFLILKVIGRGSFGKVYLVRHKESGQPYAMKILKKDQLIKKNLLVKTQGKSIRSFC